jgi:osmotically-inducible protein OsmY
VFDHISFEVDGSTVTLSGKVLSLGTRSQAARVAKRIPGIENVVNNIENLSPSSFDSSIRRRTFVTLARSPGISGYLQEPNPSVRIIVDGGHVTLEGYVNNESTADSMYVMARGVTGTFSVTNNLKIGKGGY